MSVRQNLYFASIFLKWFNRLTFNGKAAVCFIALGLFAIYAYIHNHPSPGTPPKSGQVASTNSGQSAPTGTAGCADKLVYGAPRQTASPSTEQGELRTVCRDGYVLGHSAKTKTALWVAEHLTPAGMGGKEPRTNVFLEDTTLPPGEHSTLADYKRSGYDRGHMAPAGDFSTSPHQMAESFYLSNMVPQFPENNQGPWMMLESHVRSLAKRADDLYVVTGPIFPAVIQTTVGPNHVAVPTQLYKLALDSKSGRIGAWLMPNAEVPKNQWNDYCTSVAKVEQASGLTFFPDLPAAQKTSWSQVSCAMN